MSNTIDLLEAIGKDAALRHASAEDLGKVLEQANASDALKAAVQAGDSSLLGAELGHKPMRVNHDSHTGGHEGEEPDHKDDQDHPQQPANPVPSDASHA
ncbi:hypothetical protein [Dyella sp. ASV21]|jgi:hypothetical protein|uniref:hypothetical protein n=1 Tax=Dyella sp. ASV21 TaxID=2795114 RepID=UPI0018EAC877|nr:hypothetical protein [Dyella sp. ASV21]